MKVLRINDEWVIRGTQEIPRLYNWYNNKTIKLNNDILSYILDCDGSMTFEQICEKNGVGQDTANKFYKQFISAGAIDVIDFYEKKEIDVSLGAKEPWLKEVHLDVTDHCNLRCKHCFWGDNITCKENLPIGKWKDLILDLKKTGVGKVVISGGEAFTRNDLLDIIRECYINKIFVGAIFTNGTIKNVNVCNVINYLIENKLETSFYVSMDGYTEEQHDFIRGTGNFKNTLEFVKMLVQTRREKEGKYKILINSIIHKKNYTNLIEWYDYLEKLGVDSWRFTTGRIAGSLQKNVDDIKISSVECFPQYIELTQYAIEKYKKNEGINLNVENFFNTRYLDRGKVYLFDKCYSICDYKSNACSIDPYGNVQFCTGWQNKKYGNVFDESISDIWYSDELQKVKNFKIEYITECKDCKYLKYCGGGCRLEAQTMYSKDEFVCETFRMFDECMMPILREQKLEFV